MPLMRTKALFGALWWMNLEGRSTDCLFRLILCPFSVVHRFNMPHYPKSSNLCALQTLQLSLGCRQRWAALAASSFSESTTAAAAAITVQFPVAPQYNPAQRRPLPGSQQSSVQRKPAPGIERGLTLSSPYVLQHPQKHRLKRRMNKIRLLSHQHLMLHLHSSNVNLRQCDRPQRIVMWY